MRARWARHAWLQGTLAIAAAGVVPTALAHAADFRIHTRVFMGNEKKPASENTTLFKDGVVYDYIAEPNEVTIFDPRRGRFVVLDVDRRLRAEIPTKDVAGRIQQLRELMAQQNNNEVAVFFQKPVFERSVDPQTKELVFDSQYLKYRIEPLRPKSDEILRSYIQFANWYAQLNAVTKPGSTPPFPRMVINDHLQAQGVIPARVEFTAVNNNRVAAVRSVTLHSDHEVQWKLFGEDLRRIEETGRQLVSFKKVSPSDYLQIDGQLSGKPVQASRPQLGAK